MKQHKTPKYKKLLPITEEPISNQEIVNFIKPSLEYEDISKYNDKWSVDDDIYRPIEINMYYYRLISRILSYKVEDYNKFSTYRVKWDLGGFNIVSIAKKYKHLLFTKY